MITKKVKVDDLFDDVTRKLARSDARARRPRPPGCRDA